MTSVNVKKKAPLKKVVEVANMKKRPVKTLGGYDSQSSESEESVQGEQDGEMEELDQQASAISALEAKNFKFASRTGKPVDEEDVDDDDESEEEGALGDEDFMDDEFADDDLDGMPEDDGEGDEGEEGSDGEDEKSGLADVMSKILSKSVAKGNAPILAKDKTIERKLEEEKIEIKARKALAREKKMKADKERKPISDYSISHEKTLKKVSTRGVVKLFNALRKENGESTSSVTKSKASAAKKAAVTQMSKSNFLDMLKTSGSAKSQAAASSKKEKGKVEPEKTWDVFKDDYMMGAKMKDWEKEEEEEVENEFEREIESEYE